jgi:hypothetical protein
MSPNTEIDDIKLADATIYTAIADMVTSNTEVSTILPDLTSLLYHHRNLQYTTKHNVLKLLLVFTFPNTTSGTTLAGWIRDILDVENRGEHLDSPAVDLFEFATSVSNHNENGPKNKALLQTTQDMILSVDEEAALYEFPGPDSNLVFNFVKAKLLHWSKYTGDLNEYLLLFKLVEGYPPFELWYQGVIVPFFTYSKSYPDKTSLQFYLSCCTLTDQFNILIAPLSFNEPPQITHWISTVILPLIKYHNYTVDPLLAELFCPQVGPPSKKYHLWHDVLKAFVESPDFDFDHYKEVVRCYLGSIYYYSNDETSGKIASVEITKIYDSIRDTLSLFKLGTANDIQLEGNPQAFLTFEEFLMDPQNPLKLLFEPTFGNLAELNQIVDVCQKLFPSNKLTIKEYLVLKTGETNDKEKEIKKCCSNISKSNWAQWLVSIELIISTFVNENEKNRINSLVIERFLFANLFEVVEKFQEKSSLEIDSQTYYKLVLSKWWDSFNAATNLNEKIGHLRDATDCLKLFDKMDLPQDQRDEIIRIKHLLKAIYNMKNFKIVVEKNVPFTPKKLEDFKENPLELITIILEQNPKSYLAFEKLYKILNDISLYFQIEENQFHKVKTACVESALIDNNFQFAYKQTTELLEHYNAFDLNENWLTFYQVGKFVNVKWFDEDSPEKFEILQQQQEILAKTLLIMDTTNENTQVVLRQWTSVTNQINEFHLSNDLQKITDVKFKNTTKFSGSDIKEIGDLANNIISDATATGSQAGAKISNMLVSGLGWAIGAHK